MLKFVFFITIGSIIMDVTELKSQSQFESLEQARTSMKKYFIENLKDLKLSDSACLDGMLYIAFRMDSASNIYSVKTKVYDNSTIDLKKEIDDLVIRMINSTSGRWLNIINCAEYKNQSSLLGYYFVMYFSYTVGNFENKIERENFWIGEGYINDLPIELETLDVELNTSKK